MRKDVAHQSFVRKRNIHANQRIVCLSSDDYRVYIFAELCIPIILAFNLHRFQKIEAAVLIGNIAIDAACYKYLEFSHIACALYYVSNCIHPKKVYRRK